MASLRCPLRKNCPLASAEPSRFLRPPPKPLVLSDKMSCGSRQCNHEGQPTAPSGQPCAPTPESADQSVRDGDGVRPPALPAPSHAGRRLFVAIVEPLL